MVTDVSGADGALNFSLKSPASLQNRCPKNAAKKMLGKAERIVILANNARALESHDDRNVPQESSLRSNDRSPLLPSSFQIQPSSTLAPPHTLSLPVGGPRSDRFRCGGRESKFQAVIGGYLPPNETFLANMWRQRAFIF
jgi:hypothetical protein